MPRFQLGEISSFELVASPHEKLAGLVGFGALRAQVGVVERGQVQRGRMLALVKRHEIRGGEEYVTAVSLQLPFASGALYTEVWGRRGSWR